MAASQPREPLFRASGSRQVIFPAALRRRVNFLRGLDFAAPAPRRCCRRGAAAAREGTHSSPSRPSRGEDGIFVGHVMRPLPSVVYGTRPATHASCALPAQRRCYQDFDSMAANPDDKLLGPPCCCRSVRARHCCCRWTAVSNPLPRRARTPQSRRSTRARRLGSEHTMCTALTDPLPALPARADGTQAGE